MYKLFVFSSDEKWVQLFAEWKLGDIMTFAIHWFLDREKQGHYRLDNFRVLVEDEAYIYFQLGKDIL